MKKLIKQRVYLPVSEFNKSERAICTIGIPDLYGDRVVEEEGYFFASWQLNQLLSDVIKDTLYQTTQSVELQYECGRKSKEGCLAVFCNNCNEQVDNNSIYSAFDKIFEKHKV